MSWTHKQRISAVALVILVVSVPVLWQVSNVRAAYTTEEQQTDLVNQTVTARQAPNDYDGDGVTDSSDKCPTRPETDNGFEDTDGCPDVVATTGAS
jgi:hypothetical protein